MSLPDVVAAAADDDDMITTVRMATGLRFSRLNAPAWNYSADGLSSSRSLRRGEEKQFTLIALSGVMPQSAGLRKSRSPEKSPLPLES